MTVSKEPVMLKKSHTWKLAALTAVTLPAFTLVACTTTGEEGVSGASEVSGTEAQGESPEAPAFAGERLPSSVVDGAPKGVDVTEPGRELSFGDAGYVVTGGVEAPQYWRVKVQEPEEIDADDVALTGDDNEDVGTFVCLTYTVELLHAEAAPETSAETSAETSPETSAETTEAEPDTDMEPEPEAFEAAVPELDPVDDKAREANRVLYAGEAECGVDEEDALPSDLADVEPDTTYTRAVLSYTDKDPRRGITPTGLAFTYDLDGASGTADATDTSTSTEPPEPTDEPEETPDNDVVLWN
ncbi:hypothetical protein [Corynebacterium kalidii]